jgi:hypothetical protein
MREDDFDETDVEAELELDGDTDDGVAESVGVIAALTVSLAMLALLAAAVGTTPIFVNVEDGA